MNNLPDLSKLNINNINELLYKIHNLECKSIMEQDRINYRSSRIKVYKALCEMLVADFDLYFLMYNKKLVPYMDCNFFGYVFSEERFAVETLKKMSRDDISVYKIKKENIFDLFNMFLNYEVKKFLLDYDNFAVSVKLHDLNFQRLTDITYNYESVYTYDDNKFDKKIEFNSEIIIDTAYEIEKLSKSIDKQKSIINHFKLSFFGYGKEQKNKAKEKLIVLNRRFNKLKNRKEG